MPAETLAALAVFAFVMSITPGPNNLMLMASGANFGLRRTVPHMLGVGIGFVVMTALVGTGLVGLFDRVAGLWAAMQVAGAAYLLWLAWRIAHAAAPAEGRGTARPLTFLQAAAFQWVNPKAWAMAVSAVALYAPGQATAAVLVVAAVFGAVNLPSVAVWAVAGRGLRRWLDAPVRLRLFNRTMAALLVASMLPVWLAGTGAP